MRETFWTPSVKNVRQPLDAVLLLVGVCVPGAAALAYRSACPMSGHGEALTFSLLVLYPLMLAPFAWGLTRRTMIDDESVTVLGVLGRRRLPLRAIRSIRFRPFRRPKFWMYVRSSDPESRKLEARGQTAVIVLESDGKPFDVAPRPEIAAALVRRLPGIPVDLASMPSRELLDRQALGLAVHASLTSAFLVAGASAASIVPDPGLRIAVGAAVFVLSVAWFRLGSGLSSRLSIPGWARLPFQVGAQTYVLIAIVLVINLGIGLLMSQKFTRRLGDVSKLDPLHPVSASVSLAGQPLAFPAKWASRCQEEREGLSCELADGGRIQIAVDDAPPFFDIAMAREILEYAPDRFHLLQNPLTSLRQAFAGLMAQMLRPQQLVVTDDATTFLWRGRHGEREGLVFTESGDELGIELTGSAADERPTRELLGVLGRAAAATKACRVADAFLRRR